MVKINKPTQQQTNEACMSEIPEELDKLTKELAKRVEIIKKLVDEIDL